MRRCISRCRPCSHDGHVRLGSGIIGWPLLTSFGRSWRGSSIERSGYILFKCRYLRREYSASVSTRSNQTRNDLGGEHRERVNYDQHDTPLRMYSPSLMALSISSWSLRSLFPASKDQHQRASPRLGLVHILSKRPRSFLWKLYL